MVVANTGRTNIAFLNSVTTNSSGNYDVVVTNTFGGATSQVATVTVHPSAGAEVMRLRMGDNDPGATAGNPGNAQTVDAILGNHLDASGSPFYSNNGPGRGRIALDGF